MHPRTPAQAAPPRRKRKSPLAQDVVRQLLRRIGAPMRPLLPMAALALLLAGAGSMAQATTDFRGGGYVTNFSPACGWGPARDIWVVYGRLRPAGLPGNGPVTRLTMVFEGGAMNFSRRGRLQRSWQRMDNAYVWGGAGIYQVAPLMRVTTQDPPNNNLNRNTRKVLLEGQIQRFDGIPDCSVTFHLIMGKRER